MKAKFINRLGVKLIIAISLILLINQLIFTYFSISSLRTDIRKALVQNTYNISDIIKKSSRYSMLHNRREDLSQIINTVGTEEGIDKVSIYNKAGVISFSSEQNLISTKVDLNSSECIVCHEDPALPINLPVIEMIREFTNEKGENVLGMINPIYNEPDCYSADCHVHDSKTKVLGVLDVTFTTDKMDEIVQSNRKRIIINSILMTLIISGFSGLFITLMVIRPLRKISTGISALADGNLKYNIDLKLKDELGSMANQFNDMALKLDSAYQEIKNWSETLNEKVVEKNKELKDIYKQIIQIEKLSSLGKLSATVAHEINNPLEGILTYSKLIIRKLAKKNEDGQHNEILKFLELIADESARCGKIVKDLLTFSRKEEGIVGLCDVTSAIERSIAIVRHHIVIKKIKLEIDFQHADIAIHGHYQKIQQAVVALLINAIEATSVGGLIKITTRVEGNNLILKIIDDGRGIKESDLPFIFEPFFTTKEAEKGTGLGLAVVYGIITQHKGKIFVEETSDLGTTFTINIPINAEDK